MKPIRIPVASPWPLVQSPPPDSYVPMQYKVLEMESDMPDSVARRMHDIIMDTRNWCSEPPEAILLGPLYFQAYLQWMERQPKFSTKGTPGQYRFLDVPVYAIGRHAIEIALPEKAQRIWLWEQLK